jgi:hypothetical protein
MAQAGGWHDGSSPKLAIQLYVFCSVWQEKNGVRELEKK